MTTTFKTFSVVLFRKVAALGFQQGELAKLYGRSRQTIWAWTKCIDTKGVDGYLPTDPTLCRLYDVISDKILAHASKRPLPALDSTTRQAYVNDLAAELKKL